MPSATGVATAYKVGIVILVVFCILFFSAGSANDTNFNVKPRESILAEEASAIQILNASHVGDFEPEQDRWLDISGFRNGTRFTWSGLQLAKDLALSQRSYAMGQSRFTLLENGTSQSLGFYKKISGSIEGRWTKVHEHTGVVPSRSNGHKKGFINGLSGDVAMTVEEYESGEQENIRRDTTYPTEVSWIRSTLTIEDPHSRDTVWKTRLNGVHVKAEGSLLLVSTSSQLGGIFGLPQLGPAPSFFDPVKDFIVSQLNRTMTAQAEYREWIANPWTSRLGIGAEISEDELPPECHLVVYMQQHAPYNSDALVAKFEAELAEPSGMMLGQAKDMTFAMIAFSPDCGYILESKGPPVDVLREGNHLSGPKIEIEITRIRNHVLVFTLVLLCQLRLFMVQMEQASTPSVLSRLSAPTFVLMFLGDNGCSMILGTYSLVYPTLGITLLAGLFVSFLCSTFFALRLLLNILAAQASVAHPRGTTGASSQERHDAAASTSASAAGTSVLLEPGTLPLPATARRPTDSGITPIVLPSGQVDSPPDTTTGTTLVRGSGGPVHAVLLGLNFILMFATVSALSWRSSLQRVYFFCLTFVLMSPWIPQIYRNTIRNCRKALRWDFVIGQSILRLLPVAYVYVYPYNIFWTRQHWWIMYFMTGWVWLQIVALASQSFFGPRLFIRDDWLPPAYDYHPILTMDDEGQGLPIGAKDARAGAAPDTKEYECVICMQDVQVRTVASRDEIDGGFTRGAEAMLARRAYMVTPCRHIFHSKCLSAWLNLRLQCPMCREPVPAV